MTKIPTPSNILPYLNAIKIEDKHLIHVLKLSIYMASHLNDLHLISKFDTHQTPKIFTKHHSSRKASLVVNVNKDIFLCTMAHIKTLTRWTKNGHITYKP